MSYGIRPGDLDRMTRLGIDRYIQQQLNPSSESPELTQQIDQLTTLQKTPVELYQWHRQFNPRSQQGDPQANQLQQRNIRRQILEEAIQARLLRAVNSDRQLQEQMVDFWFNHFNVFSGKGLTRLWVGAYENTAIRPHALGRFRDLLEATARHPAMLYYLDNWQNTNPDSPGVRGRFKGLNENYARELMELHTIGVNGGYTQQDVVTLARIFTGWGLSHSRPGSDPSGFVFDENRHDFSDKTFLGQSIKGSGIKEGQQALDILAKHPSTARQISFKLAQYFVSDQPPQALVDRLSQRFLATDGNIRSVLETLFKSSEFWDSQSFDRKFKTPYQYVVSAMRATGTEVTDVRRIQATLEQLGMPIYGCQTPEGYKNTEAAWLNPDAMTRRLSFATAFSRGQFLRQQDKVQSASSSAIQVSRNNPIDANQLMKTLGDRFSDQTRSAIAQSPPNLRSALVLGSPEFMRR
ncbi:DUF1800 domain-containing protein [Pseudanabaenaceae cyanobacterium LEGE 13415]|nr:DUF1800 domain-containing protein [Pseudanabaenaceae cyanobacterium LEGE 13415]